MRIEANPLWKLAILIPGEAQKCLMGVGGRGDEHRGAGGYWSSTPGVLGEDTGAAGPPGAHVGPFSCR